MTYLEDTPLPFSPVASSELGYGLIDSAGSECSLAVSSHERWGRAEYLEEARYWARLRRELVTALNARYAAQRS